MTVEIEVAGLETDQQTGLYLKFLELAKSAEADGKRIDLATWRIDVIKGTEHVFVPTCKKAENQGIILYGPGEIEDALILLVTHLTGRDKDHSEFLEETRRSEEAVIVEHHSHHNVHLWEWQINEKSVVGIEVLSDNHGVFGLTWYVRGEKERKNRLASLGDFLKSYR